MTLYLCCVCEERFSDSDAKIAHMSLCGRCAPNDDASRMCMKCTRTYIKKSGSFKCINCGKYPVLHVDSQFEQMDTFQQAKSAGFIVPCAHPNCNGLFKPETDIAQEIQKCTICGLVQCIGCGNPPHPETACKGNADMYGNDHTICPHCRQGICKVQGTCNHMTCTYCGTHFCYICGGSFMDGRTQVPKDAMRAHLMGNLYSERCEGIIQNCFVSALILVFFFVLFYLDYLLICSFLFLF